MGREGYRGIACMKGIADSSPLFFKALCHSTSRGLCDACRNYYQSSRGRRPHESVLSDRWSLRQGTAGKCSTAPVTGSVADVVTLELVPVPEEPVVVDVVTVPEGTGRTVDDAGVATTSGTGGMAGGT